MLWFLRPRPLSHFKDSISNNVSTTLLRCLHDVEELLQLFRCVCGHNQILINTGWRHSFFVLTFKKEFRIRQTVVWSILPLYVLKSSSKLHLILQEQNLLRFQFSFFHWLVLMSIILVHYNYAFDTLTFLLHFVSRIYHGKWRQYQ